MNPLVAYLNDPVVYETLFANFEKRCNDKDLSQWSLGRVFNELPRDQINLLDSTVQPLDKTYVEAIQNGAPETWFYFYYTKASQDLFDEKGELRAEFHTLFNNLYNRYIASLSDKTNAPQIEGDVIEALYKAQGKEKVKGYLLNAYLIIVMGEISPKYNAIVNRPDIVEDEWLEPDFNPAILDEETQQTLAAQKNYLTIAKTLSEHYVNSLGKQGLDQQILTKMNENLASNFASLAAEKVPALKEEITISMKAELEETYEKLIDLATDPSLNELTKMELELVILEVQKNAVFPDSQAALLTAMKNAILAVGGQDNELPKVLHSLYASLGDQATDKTNKNAYRQSEYKYSLIILNEAKKDQRLSDAFRDDCARLCAVDPFRQSIQLANGSTKVRTSEDVFKKKSTVVLLHRAMIAKIEEEKAQVSTILSSIADRRYFSPDLKNDAQEALSRIKSKPAGDDTGNLLRSVRERMEQQHQVYEANVAARRPKVNEPVASSQVVPKVEEPKGFFGKMKSAVSGFYSRHPILTPALVIGASIVVVGAIVATGGFAAAFPIAGAFVVGITAKIAAITGVSTAFASGVTVSIGGVIAGAATAVVTSVGRGIRNLVNYVRGEPAVSSVVPTPSKPLSPTVSETFDSGSPSPSSSLSSNPSSSPSVGSGISTPSMSSGTATPPSNDHGFGSTAQLAHADPNFKEALKEDKEKARVADDVEPAPESAPVAPSNSNAEQPALPDDANSPRPGGNR